MIVKNNGYWLRCIAMGKRSPRKNVGTHGPVNFDWSSCKTLQVKFYRYKPSARTIQRRIREDRSPRAKVDGQLMCHISPGRY